MPRTITKIFAFALSFLLIFEQSGFAQVAGQLDISGHFMQLRSSFAQDKFRPLHLRYISYDNLKNSFKILLDKGDLSRGLSSHETRGLSPQGTVPDGEVTEETRKLLNYFFIGISLPNNSFWVNLRPDSPDNMIDSYLGQTDVGKILLEADLQLKKDTAQFTSPQTPEGKDYWDKLYKKAEELLGYDNITIPTLTRPWIVPDEIIIRETPENAYVYKATLKVMLEQDYLKDSATYNFNDVRLKKLNEYSSQLIRETIIPKLTKEINSAKRYAPLRQVYYSLILAQWFKARYYGRSGLYSWLIDKRKLDGLTSKEPWSKKTYFQAYQKSFKDGEYNIKEPMSTPMGQTVRSYFSGGANLEILGMPSKGSSPLGQGSISTNDNLTIIGSSQSRGVMTGKTLVINAKGGTPDNFSSSAIIADPNQIPEAGKAPRLLESRSASSPMASGNKMPLAASVELLSMHNNKGVLLPAVMARIEELIAALSVNRGSEGFLKSVENLKREIGFSSPPLVGQGLNEQQRGLNELLSSKNTVFYGSKMKRGGFINWLEDYYSPLINRGMKIWFEEKDAGRALEDFERTTALMEEEGVAVDIEETRLILGELAKNNASVALFRAKYKDQEVSVPIISSNQGRQASLNHVDTDSGRIILARILIREPIDGLSFSWDILQNVAHEIDHAVAYLLSPSSWAKRKVTEYFVRNRLEYLNELSKINSPQGKDIEAGAYYEEEIREQEKMLSVAQEEKLSTDKLSNLVRILTLEGLATKAEESFLSDQVSAEVKNSSFFGGWLLNTRLKNISELVLSLDKLWRYAHPSNFFHYLGNVLVGALSKRASKETLYMSDLLEPLIKNDPGLIKEYLSEFVHTYTAVTESYNKNTGMSIDVPVGPEASLGRIDTSFYGHFLPKDWLLGEAAIQDRVNDKLNRMTEEEIQKFYSTLSNVSKSFYLRRGISQAQAVKEMLRQESIEKLWNDIGTPPVGLSTQNKTASSSAQTKMGLDLHDWLGEEFPEKLAKIFSKEKAEFINLKDVHKDNIVEEIKKSLAGYPNNKFTFISMDIVSSEKVGHLIVADTVGNLNDPEYGLGAYISRAEKDHGALLDKFQFVLEVDNFTRDNGPVYLKTFSFGKFDLARLLFHWKGIRELEALESIQGVLKSRYGGKKIAALVTNPKVERWIKQNFNGRRIDKLSLERIFINDYLGLGNIGKENSLFIGEISAAASPVEQKASSAAVFSKADNNKMYAKVISMAKDETLELLMEPLEIARLEQVLALPQNKEILEAYLSLLQKSPPAPIKLYEFSGPEEMHFLTSPELDIFAVNKSISTSSVLEATVPAPAFKKPGEAISQSELNDLYWNSIAAYAEEMVSEAQMSAQMVRDENIKLGVAEREELLHEIMKLAVNRIHLKLINIAQGQEDIINALNKKKKELINRIEHGSMQNDFAIAIAAWIGEQAVNNGQGDFTNVYFPRDSGLFHISDRVLGMLQGKKRNTFLYYISGNNATFKDYYFWMKTTIAELNRKYSDQKEAINKLKDIISTRMEVDQDFKAKIDQIMQELRDMGISDYKKLRFIDSGFVTFPIMFAAIALMINPEAEVQALVQSSKANNILPQLDTNNWLGKIRNWIKRITAGDYANPSIGYSEDTGFLRHPFEAGDDGMLRAVSLERQLEAYWLQLTMAMGTITYYDALTGLAGEFEQFMSKDMARKYAEKLLSEWQPKQLAAFSPDNMQYIPSAGNAYSKTLSNLIKLNNDDTYKVERKKLDWDIKKVTGLPSNIEAGPVDLKALQNIFDTHINNVAKAQKKDWKDWVNLGLPVLSATLFGDILNKYFKNPDKLPPFAKEIDNKAPLGIKELFANLGNQDPVYLNAELKELAPKLDAQTLDNLKGKLEELAEKTDSQKPVDSKAKLKERVLKIIIILALLLPVKGDIVGKKDPFYTPPGQEKISPQYMESGKVISSPRPWFINSYNGKGNLDPALHPEKYLTSDKDLMEVFKFLRPKVDKMGIEFFMRLLNYSSEDGKHLKNAQGRELNSKDVRYFLRAFGKINPADEKLNKTKRMAVEAAIGAYQIGKGEKPTFDMPVSWMKSSDAASSAVDSIKGAASSALENNPEEIKSKQEALNYFYANKGKLWNSMSDAAFQNYIKENHPLLELKDGQLVAKGAIPRSEEKRKEENIREGILKEIQDMPGVFDLTGLKTLEGVDNFLMEQGFTAPGQNQEQSKLAKELDKDLKAILLMAEKNNIMAHGVSGRMSPKGGIDLLLSILLDGKIQPSERDKELSFAYFARLDTITDHKEKPAYYGPFYILLGDEYNFSSNIEDADDVIAHITDEDQSHQLYKGIPAKDHRLYLVPTDADVDYLKKGLGLAVERKAMDQEEAGKAELKIITYAQFVKNFSGEKGKSRLKKIVASSSVKSIDAVLKIHAGEIISLKELAGDAGVSITDMAKRINEINKDDSYPLQIVPAVGGDMHIKEKKKALLSGGNGGQGPSSRMTDYRTIKEYADQLNDVLPGLERWDLISFLGYLAKAHPEEAVYVDAGSGVGGALGFVIGKFRGKIRAYGIDKENKTLNDKEIEEIVLKDQRFKEEYANYYRLAKKADIIIGNIDDGAQIPPADLITSFFMLQYTKDPLGAWVRMFNSLKPGGRVVAHLLIPEDRNDLRVFYSNFMGKLKESGIITGFGERMNHDNGTMNIFLLAEKTGSQEIKLNAKPIRIEPARITQANEKKFEIKVVSYGDIDLKVVAGSPIADTPEQLTSMFTTPERLDNSKEYISAEVDRMLKDNITEPVVFDIGVGWYWENGPVTVRELSDALKGRARVVGIDNQIPSFAVHMKDKTILFDERGQVISAEQVFGGNTRRSRLAREDRERYDLLGMGLIQKAERQGKRDYVDERGNQIQFDPIRNFQNGSLNFIKADLFKLSEEFKNGRIPQAHIVRIANVLLPHYLPADISPALEQLIPVVHEGGTVLIGYATQRGYGQEEYLVYRKKDGAFILDKYMFAMNGHTAVPGVGTSPRYDSPAYDMREYFTKKFLERSEKWNDFVKTSKKERGWLDEAAKNAPEMAKIVAQGLAKEGISSEALGAFVSVGLEPLRTTEDTLKHELLRRIRNYYVDSGSPLKVAGSPVEAINQQAGFKTLESDLDSSDINTKNNAATALWKMFVGNSDNISPALNIAFRELARDGDGKTGKTDALLSRILSVILGIPTSIFVSHDYSYSTAKKMADRYGKKQIWLMVFDAHTDGGYFGTDGAEVIGKKSYQAIDEANWIQAVMSEELAKGTVLLGNEHLQAMVDNYPRQFDGYKYQGGGAMKAEKFLEGSDTETRLADSKGILLSVDLDYIFGLSEDALPDLQSKMAERIGALARVIKMLGEKGIPVLGIDFVRSLSASFRANTSGIVRDYAHKDLSDYILANVANGIKDVLSKPAAGSPVGEKAYLEIERLWKKDPRIESTRNHMHDLVNMVAGLTNLYEELQGLGLEDLKARAILFGNNRQLIPTIEKFSYAPLYIEALKEFSKRSESMITKMKKEIERFKQKNEEAANSTDDAMHGILGYIGQFYKILEDFRVALNFEEAEIAKLRDLDINQMLLSVANLNPDGKNIKIVSEFQEEKLLFHANEADMLKVFMNLIVNAGQAIRAKEEGTLLLRTYKSGDVMVVEVGDNGIGIPGGSIAKIFTREYTNKENGSGLGLDIVQGIVNKYQGSISVKSNPGEGTVFTLKFPLVPAGQAFAGSPVGSDKMPIANLNGINKLIEMYLPVGYKDKFDIPNLPLHVHQEGPTLRHHLQAMLNVLDNAGALDIPVKYKNILVDKNNRKFFELFIIMHDIGKTRINPEIVVEKENARQLYPRHEAESTAMLKDDQSLGQAEGVDRDLLLEVVRLHGASYAVSKSSMDAAEFEDFISKNQVNGDLDKVVSFLIAVNILDVQGTFRQDPLDNRPLNFARGYEEYAKLKSSGSPVDNGEKASSSVSDKGGIDFRGLPIVTQRQPVVLGGNPFRGLSPQGTVPIVFDKTKMDEAWQEMQNMLNAGIIPSSERIKEYLLSCCQGGDFGGQADKVLAVIADILRMEEDRSVSTEPELKDFLVLLESDKAPDAVQKELNNITVPPKAPVLVE